MSYDDAICPLDSDGSPFGLQPIEVIAEPAPRRRAAATAAAVKLSHPNHLPPVGCPLLILFDGELIRAERTSFIEKRDRQLEYRTDDGQVITGRFEWTYP